ncbi:uncharacterized protein LOC123705417 [Colias croceus]|uniref:uncharacterized protein LOC123705417 n=1 Tax=Colias crocea TaxID=72248 RepID=UPI001E28047D|nr:uncharacterized protein LOC123705417 [Colias croceus]
MQTRSIQHFWRHWHLEYIAELQQRTKWRLPVRCLQQGDLVLVKEDNVPPLNWRFARVTKLFPGADGILRVAEVATTSGSYRRGVKYLCPLLDDAETVLEPDVSNGPQYV